MIKNVLYLASGVAIGYYAAHRRLEAYFNERLDKEVEDAKEFYREQYTRRATKDYMEDPEFMEAAIKAAEALKIYEGITVGPSILAQEMTEAVRRDEELAAEADEAEDPVMDIAEAEARETELTYELAEEAGQAEPEEPPVEEGPWSQWVKTLSDDEVPSKPAPPVPIVPEQPLAGVVNYNRISTTPKDVPSEKKEPEYVPETIEKEAFINGDSGFEQYTVTYFIGDDILANDHDQVITDEARLAFLGSETFDLLKSPEARGGANAVYIRNNLRNREFEIILSPGNYTDEVGEVVYATE